MSAVHSRLVSFLTTILSLSGAWTTSVHAEQRLCTDHGILIEGNRVEDVADACEAVKSAAPFFGIAGLAMPGNIVIRLVGESSSPFLDDHEIGHYDAKLHAIVMRDYRAAAAQSRLMEPGLGAVASRAHWQSYIVHELAHAAIHAGCDQTSPSRAIHEYVAAVAQISALPEAHRARLLNGYRDLEAFGRESEITEIYYALNPRYFAVKSYKHYRQLPDPQAFLRGLLNPR